jgi:NhaP-type Na+/H+ and K+/H+ antiporter
MENSLWKRLRTCREADSRVNDLMCMILEVSLIKSQSRASLKDSLTAQYIFFLLYE